MRGSSEAVAGEVRAFLDVGVSRLVVPIGPTDAEGYVAVAERFAREVVPLAEREKTGRKPQPWPSLQVETASTGESRNRGHLCMHRLLGQARSLLGAKEMAEVSSAAVGHARSVAWKPSSIHESLAIAGQESMDATLATRHFTRRGPRLS